MKVTVKTRVSSKKFHCVIFYDEFKFHMLLHCIPLWQRVVLSRHREIMVRS